MLTERLRDYCNSLNGGRSSSAGLLLKERKNQRSLFLEGGKVKELTYPSIALRSHGGLQSILTLLTPNRKTLAISMLGSLRLNMPPKNEGGT